MNRESIIVRVGLPKTTGRIALEARRRGYPALVSAGALWDPHRETFRVPGMLLLRMASVVLDSAGFVRGLSGYPWTVAQYVLYAVTWHFFEWWAQMDLPCEEALAPDKQAVRARVRASAALFAECLAESRRLRAEGYRFHSDPMPVLQGRDPEDYALSAALLAEICGGSLPPLVGVGSMCTREVGGPAGVLAIVEALDKLLPPGVRLHLFGVKGPALRQLAAMAHRVASTDSMGWDFGERMDAFNEGRPNTAEGRALAMVEWMEAQAGHLREGELLLGV